VAEEQNEGQEKTLDPTPQRLQRARDQGDIPKSVDLNTFLAYLGLFLTLTIAITFMAREAGAALSSFLAAPHLMVNRILAPGGMGVLAAFLGPAALAILPIIIVPAICVLIALIAQRAIVFAPTKIEPKLSRLSLISNAKQKFGANGLVEFLKSVSKMIAIAIVVAVAVSWEIEGYITLVALDGRSLPEIMLKQGMIVITAALVIAGAIAALDYVWQVYAHRQRLRMSFQEMKDETKSAEGDPTFKQTRRERGREIAMNRSIADVPTADVVIVNPIHYAVALKWSREPGSAPVCVSKGVDAIAARIRETALAHNVPVHRDPPTARLLYDVVEIGDEIEADHYQAVAVAIRFADETRRRAKARQWLDGSA
jgi:flagellar biosynthetic protein FlhB